MKTFIPSVALALLALAAALSRLPLGQAAQPDDAEKSLAGDLKLLEDAGVKTDGPGLVVFFRKQTLTEEQRRGIRELINQLGDDRFEVRQKATRKLIALGPAAESASCRLRHHTRDLGV